MFLKSFIISETDIFLIMENLNADKAYGWDSISIRMIQLRGRGIALPIKVLFISRLEDMISQTAGKKLI